jgi:hypothetical protein
MATPCHKAVSTRLPQNSTDDEGNMKHETQTHAVRAQGGDTNDANMLTNPALTTEKVKSGRTNTGDDREDVECGTIPSCNNRRHQHGKSWVKEKTLGRQSQSSSLRYLRIVVPPPAVQLSLNVNCASMTGTERNNQSLEIHR